MKDGNVISTSRSGYAGFGKRGASGGYLLMEMICCSKREKVLGSVLNLFLHSL